MLKKMKIRIFLISLLLVSSMLCSCKGVEISGKTEDVESYTEAEAMIVLGSERNKVKNVMGSQIWDVPIQFEKDDNYGDYFINSTRAFLQDIKTLNLYAERNGISINSAEMNKIRKVSDEFYNVLSDEDREFMSNPSKKDVEKIYKEYFLASKVASNILKDIEIEIPDADAKIIEIMLIECSSKDKADKLLLDVNERGANFEYYAGRYSESSVIDYRLAKNAKDDNIYRTAFSLDENEISPVIAENGKYYIIKCINSYDEEATLERKQRLERAIETEGFRSWYNEYRENHIVRFRDEFWENIDLNANNGSTCDNFFGLFNEYFKDDLRIIK